MSSVWQSGLGLVSTLASSLTFCPKSFYLTERHVIRISEGESRLVKIRIDLDKCTGCGTCVDVCPVGTFELRDNKSSAVNVDECLVCRACETQCPENAIEVIE
jgi:NAD-dependent dihydropyrimidine dehydrogenase PreA subunit